mmetsp:Transcript_4791/g.12283  ORF Transcript_4791/g.12283 Transcript_4791/m.12283 type:complete len:218 (-) Transcript_4791:16-669(-)
MQIVQRIQYIRHGRRGLTLSEKVRLEDPIQYGAPRQQVQDKAQLVVVLENIVQLDAVHVVNLLHQRHLGLEALLLGFLFANDLDGVHGSRPLVLGLVHDRIAALAQLLPNLIVRPQQRAAPGVQARLVAATTPRHLSLQDLQTSPATRLAHPRQSPRPRVAPTTEASLPEVCVAPRPLSLGPLGSALCPPTGSRAMSAGDVRFAAAVATGGCARACR